MARNQGQRPTEAELRILKLLWGHGPMTARDVHEADEVRPRVGYTGILKLLQVMEAKGLVSVDRAERSHVFKARAERRSTLSRLTRDFLERTFDGAASEALLLLVDSPGLTPEESSELMARLLELKKREAKP